MNNLSSYCGLNDAKIRASYKDLPVFTDDEDMFFDCDDKTEKAEPIPVWSKGKLISKCPFGVFKSPKKPTNFFRFLSQSLKRGQTKKMRALCTANCMILFWISYTTFLI